MTDTIHDAVAEAFAEFKPEALTPDGGTQAGAGEVPNEPESPIGVEPEKVDTAEAAEPEGAEPEEKEEEKVKEEKPKPEPKAEKAAPEEVKEEIKPKAEGKRLRPGDPGFVEYRRPPNLLPDAQELWNSVPKVVKRDFDAYVRETEERVSQYQESVQKYDRFRQYDEIASQNGRDLSSIVEKVYQIEVAAAKSPIAAIQMCLEELMPRKQNGAPVTLQELAQFVMQSDPNALNQQIHSARPQPEPQVDPEKQALQQRVQELEMATVRQSVLEPFVQSHPRYQELEGDIAFFLNSGKIPTNLSAYDRLEAAYAMAERLNPPSHYQAPQEAERLVSDNRVGPDFSGKKSIKSSPGAVAEIEPDEDDLSISELIKREMARASRK